jgi:hypothetical protein
MEKNHQGDSPMFWENIEGCELTEVERDLLTRATCWMIGFGEGGPIVWRDAHGNEIRVSEVRMRGYRKCAFGRVVSVCLVSFVRRPMVRNFTIARTLLTKTSGTFPAGRCVIGPSPTLEGRQQQQRFVVAATASPKKSRPSENNDKQRLREQRHQQRVMQKQLKKLK